MGKWRVGGEVEGRCGEVEGRCGEVEGRCGEVEGRCGGSVWRSRVCMRSEGFVWQ